LIGDELKGREILGRCREQRAEVRPGYRDIGGTNETPKWTIKQNQPIAVLKGSRI
jgi:hypothetical protein